MKKIISIAIASALVLSSMAFAQTKMTPKGAQKPAMMASHKTMKKATMKKATMKKATMKKSSMKKATMKKATMKKATMKKS